MSAVLDFPPIDQAAGTALATATPAGALAEASIKDAAIAHLRAQEPAILALAERYRDVALDLTTPKGLAAGKAARLDLRENGRFAIQRGRDKTKDLLNTAKKDVEVEAERLIGLVKPVEDHIHGQIEVREQQLADEKAERDRIAAEREAEFRKRIDVIRACVGNCQGIGSERISAGIAKVEAIVIDAAGWAEFADEAAQAKATTLAAMLNLRDQAKAREDEAARMEALRVENERIAAQQAEQAERLAAQQRALDEQAAKLAAQQKAIDDAAAKVEREKQEAKDREDAELRATAARADEELNRRQREEVRNTPAQESLQVLKAEPATADATAREAPASTSPDGGPMGAGQPAAAGPAGNEVYVAGNGVRFVRPIHPAAQALRNEQPTLTLGEIKERLGFTVTADFLAELGFDAYFERSARLYRESQFGDICAALVQHIESVRAEVALAA